MMSPLSIVVSGIIGAVCIPVMYRCLLHPLARYPGPLWGKITDWYSVYHCWMGNQHLDLHRLHEKYGNIVRVGPNRISVNTVAALQDVYSIRANVRKADFYTVFSYFFKVPMIVTTINRRDHTFKRRLLMQALNPTAIKLMEAPILTNSVTFCQSLFDEKSSTTWSPGRDMSRLFAYVTSDVMGETSFSRSWDLVRSDTNRQILTTVSRGVASLNITGHMPGILKLKMDKVLFRKLINEVKDFQALSLAQSSWRLAHAHDIKRKDLFSSLVEARDPETGRGMTEDEIVAEAGALLLAGSDTQATVLAATLFYCLHYPATLLSLQQEIRSTFGAVEEICIGQSLDSCRYLRSCLNEAMRLSPPIGGLLPRKVLTGGLTIEGEHFPEGTDVGVPHYAIHHNPRYFTDPFAFKPERWIGEDGGDKDQAVSRAESAFCAFGVGRTSCIGKRLAYQEMSIILARIMWLFDMRLQSGSSLGEGNPSLGESRSSKNEFQTWDGFFSSHQGPMVEFSARAVPAHSLRPGPL